MSDVCQEAPPAVFADQSDYREALEYTYVRRHGDLLRLLRYYGVSSADAEEIAHDVFVRAIDPGSGAPRNLFAWLVTCAKHLAIKRRYRSQRESTLGDGWWKVWETKNADEGLSAYGELERRERLETVRRAMAKLDRTEAKCLVLRSQGLTFREIGERLDIPLRRASYLVTTALEKVEQLVPK